MTTHTSKPLLQALQLASLLCLAALCGYMLGRLASTSFAASEAQITMREDTRPGVPIVRIDGVYNGMLQGTVTDGARLVIADDAVVPESDGSFAMDSKAFLTNFITVTVPDGARFVASKRGKKYYSVHSGQGQRIAPQNRVYFESAGEAEVAGFRSSTQ